MQEIGKFIDFLGQDSIREAIPVITAIGGALVVVLRFIFKVIYAQNMNEIDKVFMNRKQRTNLKLIDLFMVAIVLGLVKDVYKRQALEILLDKVGMYDNRTKKAYRCIWKCWEKETNEPIELALQWLKKNLSNEDFLKVYSWGRSNHKISGKESCK